MHGKSVVGIFDAISSTGTVEMYVDIAAKIDGGKKVVATNPQSSLSLPKGVEVLPGTSAPSRPLVW